MRAPRRSSWLGLTALAVLVVAAVSRSSLASPPSARPGSARPGTVRPGPAATPVPAVPGTGPRAPRPRSRSVPVGSVMVAAGYAMVRIEPGEFEMGSPAGEVGRESDEDAHPVRLTTPFLLGTTEVTAGLWKAVVGNLPPDHQATDPRLAVTHVSWFDAVLFCNRLSELEGLEPAYSTQMHDPAAGRYIDEFAWNPGSPGYRFPTEAEWEYAARAGRATTYANGPDRLNPWGLYDLSGNLWEWVWDRPGPYPAAATDPTGPEHGHFRGLRGGSWRSPDAQRRVAERGRLAFMLSDDTTGLRVARSLGVGVPPR